MEAPLVDRLGRTARSLRVSLTDRCNLRCRYCMPAEGLPWLDRDDLLRRDEVRRLIAMFARMGVRDVRLTGGEPLLRPDLEAIVADVAALPGIDEVTMTTNGVLLAGRVDDLVAAGLRRVNVSLDSLDPERFARITRRDALDRVLAGLEACLRHPSLRPVKVNAVLLRGISGDDVLPLAALAREGRLVVRFIEAMPLDAGRTWRPDAVLPGAEVRAAIDRRWPLVPLARARPSAPATTWRFRDGAGVVEFVSSVTEPFCAACDRLRLTADGQLRTCLFADQEADLRGALRRGEPLEPVVRQAVWGKPAGHAIGVAAAPAPMRPMSRIGG